MKMLNWQFMVQVYSGAKRLPKIKGPEIFTGTPKYAEFNCHLLFKFIILRDAELLDYFPSANYDGFVVGAVAPNAGGSF